MASTPKPSNRAKCITSRGSPVSTMMPARIPKPCGDQMMMQTGDCQQGRDRQRSSASTRRSERINRLQPLSICSCLPVANTWSRAFSRLWPDHLDGKQHIDLAGHDIRMTGGAQSLHVVHGHDRMRQFQAEIVLRRLIQRIDLAADESFPETSPVLRAKDRWVDWSPGRRAA